MYRVTCTQGYTGLPKGGQGYIGCRVLHRKPKGKEHGKLNGRLASIGVYGIGIVGFQGSRPTRVLEVIDVICIGTSSGFYVAWGCSTSDRLVVSCF